MMMIPRFLEKLFCLELGLLQFHNHRPKGASRGLCAALLRIPYDLSAGMEPQEVGIQPPAQLPERLAEGPVAVRGAALEADVRLQQRVDAIAMGPLAARPAAREAQVVIPS